MKALAVSFALVALCTVQGCNRIALAETAVQASNQPIAVGDFYAPTQPADPFKHRDWFVVVLGVEKGFVQYEIVTHQFIPFEHNDNSCTGAEFRVSFPTKVDRRAVELADKQ